MIYKFFLVLYISIYTFTLNANEAMKFFENEDYDASFRLSYSKALSGDRESEYIIGRILLEGMGTSNTKKKEGLNFLKASASKEYLKAIIFLADSYYNGGLLKANQNKALIYMKKAEKLGYNNYKKTITKLTANIQGTISKASCARYSKNDRKVAFKIGQCIQRNFLEGNPVKYYLIAFDEGNYDALTNALRFALKNKKRDDYLNIVKRIHIYYKNSSNVNKLENILADKGYDYKDCGGKDNNLEFDTPELFDNNDELEFETSDNNEVGDFDFENTENSSDDVNNLFQANENKNISECIFAAIIGDQKAAAEVAIWWRDGLNNIPVSKFMFELMLEKAESGGSIADVEGILKNLENNPKEHFKKIKSYSADNMLQDIIPKALQLEAKLIASNNYRDFATEIEDIIFTLERVDWQNINYSILGDIFIFYKKNIERNSKNTLKTKDNLKLMPFSKDLFDYLTAKNNGDKIAFNFLVNRIKSDCSALIYAQKNSSLVELSLLQDAQKKLSKQCLRRDNNINFAEIIKNSLKDLSPYKILIEEKLNSSKACDDYYTFIKNGGKKFIKDAKLLDINYSELNNSCSKTNNSHAYAIADVLHDLKEYEKAYKIVRKTCESDDAKGCELLAYMLISNQSSNAEMLSRSERKKSAIKYLKLGISNKDVKSMAMLYDLHSESYNASPAVINEREKILEKLLRYEREFIAAEIRVKGSCFKDANIISSLLSGKSCDSVCDFADDTLKEEVNNLDKGSIRALEKILKLRTCKKI